MGFGRGGADPTLCVASIITNRTGTGRSDFFKDLKVIGKLSS